MRQFTGFMRGTNLGGWLSQFDAYDPEHFRSFITRDDIQRIREFGFDHVRVPVNYEIFEDEEGNEKEEGYSYIDNCLTWCKEAGLNLILDLHRAFGYTFDPLDDTIVDKKAFFYDEGMQSRFLGLWERFAGRWGSDPAVAFELMNEIVSPEVKEEWNEVADRAVTVIRKSAEKTPIIIGGVNYNHVLNVADLRPPRDENIIYNFHCYEPLIFTHQKAYWVPEMPPELTVEYPDTVESYREKSMVLMEAHRSGIERKEITALDASFFTTLFQPAVDAAEKNNAPLYCGEYGVIDRAPVESTARWLHDIHAAFAAFGIGHAWWNYKGKDYGLVDGHYDAILPVMKQLFGG